MKNKMQIPVKYVAELENNTIECKHISIYFIEDTLMHCFYCFPEVY